MYTLVYVKKNVDPQIRVIDNEEEIVIITHPRHENNPFHRIETHRYMGGNEIYKKILEKLRLSNTDLTDKGVKYIEEEGKRVSKELITLMKNV